jgi:PBSX family phage terminase large subunit
VNVRLTELIAPAFYQLHKELKAEQWDEVFCKGGRGSTKSSFVSVEILLGIIRDSEANALVLRRYQNELRDTVYGQFEWSIAKLGLQHMFKCQVSPMQIIYIPTGQKIVFKSADNPQKLKSINLGKGYVKYLWGEEIDQFSNMEQLRNIMQSLFRGEDRKRVSFFTYNPPRSSRSWVNQEVKTEKEGRFVHHSDYTTVDPLWLGQRFITEAEHLKRVNPTSYEHEYLGLEVGTGLEVFKNLDIRTISDEEIATFDNLRQAVDFGYAVDPVAFGRLHYDKTRRRIYMFAEFHGIQVSNKKLYDNIKQYADVPIIADSAEPKSIAELKDYGLKIKGAKKGPDSIEYGIKFLQDMEQIIIDPIRCPNTAREFTNYCLETDSQGIVKSRFPDKDNHHIDRTRYALEDDMKNKTKWGF